MVEVEDQSREIQPEQLTLEEVEALRRKHFCPSVSISYSKPVEFYQNVSWSCLARTAASGDPADDDRGAEVAPDPKDVGRGDPSSGEMPTSA